MENNLHRFLLGNFAFTLLAGVCILVLAGAMNPLWFWVAIPIVSIPGFFAVFTPQQRRNFYERLVDNVLTLTAIIVTVVLGIALILWAVVNFAWQPEYDAQVTAVVLDHQDVYATVSHPGAALADGQPVEIRIAIVNRGAVTETLGITAVLPPAGDLTFVTPPKLTAVAVPPNDQLTQSIALVNANPPSGVNAIQRVTTTVTLTGAVGEQQTSLIVEGKWGLRLRRLVNSTVDKASPLIILIAFLVPGLSALLQRYVDKQTDQIKARRTDEVKRLLKQFSDHFISGDLEGATRALTLLNRTELHDYVRDEIGIAKGLLAVASLDEGDNNYAVYIQSGVIWPDVCIMAYLIARRKLRDSEDQSRREKILLSLNEARLRLPTDRIQNNYLIDRLAELEAASETIDVQPRVWPLPLDVPFTTNIQEQSRQLLQSVATGIISEEPERVQWLKPFINPKAEEDIYTLLINPKVFWSKYPLFEQLSNSNHSWLIFGAPGSGRTACALALAHWVVDKDTEAETLTVYQAGQADLGDIKTHFVHKLLKFVQLHPTHLSKLASTERELLASLFITTFGKELARAEIKRAQIDIDHPEWLSEQGDLKTRRQWQDMARTQLQLLDRTIVERPDLNQQHKNDVKADKLWALEIAACARALGFRRVRLVLDTQADDADWIEDDILFRLPAWGATGLQVFIFLPDTLHHRFPPKLTSVGCSRMQWTEKDLRKMVEHRFRIVLPRTPEIKSCFNDESSDQLLDTLISHCQLDGEYNPRIFIQLWQEIIFHLSPSSYIGVEDIMRAAVMLHVEPKPQAYNE